MSKNLQDIISQVKEITASGLPFMDGKEKVALEDGDLYTVKNYGYLTSADGDFVVVADDTTYAFGGSIVTEAFTKLDAKIDGTQIAELLKDGIPMKISKRKSESSKRNYTVCEFFPK